MRTVTEIDLLRLEMATLWGPDAYGRLRPEPLVALAASNDGRAVRFGAQGSEEAKKVSIDDAEASEAMVRFREALAPSGTIHGGPSYVFPESMAPQTFALTMLTSKDELPSRLRTARPERWWEEGEWDDLLAGRLGPWAIGMAEGRVAALCHTPVGSSLAAEAGVWTHPDERGKGYAGDVTAAWARVARQRFGTLFYSTGADNAASQAVARKLGLRPIGWIWQLRAEE